MFLELNHSTVEAENQSLTVKISAVVISLVTNHTSCKIPSSLSSIEKWKTKWKIDVDVALKIVFHWAVVKYAAISLSH